MRYYFKKINQYKLLNIIIRFFRFRPYRFAALLVRPFWYRPLGLRPFWTSTGVETYECALAEKNRYETGNFDKNMYNFYIKFILQVETWHFIFIVLNDCSWCELSEYIRYSYCWITRNALSFRLKYSHFNKNKEGSDNGTM